ncbi:hypothetical protein BL8807_07830 [Bifidobacterium lemurum]|nr:hypothetical protein BL8807_07830 [Bifidobacterium lemurum]
MAVAALALAAVLLVECAVFNLPFWRSLGASTDTNAAYNTLGPGLTRDEDGLLTVTDPTQAYLRLTADGTSDYLRIDPVDGEVLEQALQRLAESDDEETAIPRTSMRVRVDVAGESGRTASVSSDAPRSLIVKASGAGDVRVWIQEAKGTRVAFEAARANVRVPFEFNMARVVVMLAVLALVAVWRPRSRLWRVPLDPSRLSQRVGFAVVMAVPAVFTAVSVAAQIAYASPLTFHTAGNYTYDFDQYAHVADSLIAGRTWLDLEVPDALASAGNPYDVSQREELLAQGVSPIYWDYAFYEGHWYSYFGVLPAALLFVPFRLITGRMLPTAAAEQLLTFTFIVCATLLVVRLIRRIAPRTSLAAASMMVTMVLVGAQTGYLLFRTNFYQVPFVASLTLTCLGLWFWLGADTDKRPLRPADRWRAGDAKPLSLPRLAAGALCIAANFGCRPTFALTALLAFPLFWPQIRAMAADLRARRTSVGAALRAPLAMIIPAVVVVAPLMAWNIARFGSPLDFGNAYQITVADMTRYATPWVDMPLVVGYYLFLPLRFTDGFPFLAVSPAPMPEWSYYEPMVGGLFCLCPLLLAALLLPFMRRLELRGYRPFLLTCLALAMALAIFDSAVAGLGWRYMADFAWLVALAAMPVVLRAVNGRQSRVADVLLTEPSVVPKTGLGAANVAASATGVVTPARWLARVVVMLALMWMLLVVVVSCFVVGRSDALINNNAGLFHEVQSWFSLLMD